MILKIARLLYVLFLLVLIIAPMMIILLFSFTNAHWEFTFHNYVQIFQNPVHMVVFKRSMGVAFFTTLLCVIVAYPVAYYISTMSAKKQNIMILLLIIPIWSNFVLRTYAWIKLLGNNGVMNSVLGWLHIAPVQFLYNDQAIIFGMFYNLLPFMIFPIYNALVKIDRSYVEAAYDLGASRWRIFFKILLPLSLNGVKSGVFLVFIPSITFFAVSDLLGGAKGMLLGNLINQTFFVERDWHLGSSIAILLVLSILFVFCIFNVRTWLKKRQEWIFE